MTSEFDFFEGTTTADSTEPRVTVRKSGQLVLNQAAVRLLGEGVAYVQIGYSIEAGAVGLRAAKERGRGVLKLRGQPNGRSRLVDGRRFFAHHRLVVAKTLRLEVHEFAGSVAGFRLPQGEAGPPVKAAKAPGRRKAVAD